MTIGGGEPSFDWCSALVFGTVLDEGELRAPHARSGRGSRR